MMFNEKVFLTSTDTTIGFISQDPKRLTQIKSRPPHKHYIKAVNSLQTLKQHTRIPRQYKSLLRRSKRTTFIMPSGDSYRLIREPHHRLLLDRLKWAYTTSANRSGEVYNEDFAIESADIVVAPLQQHHAPSQIIKLGKHRRKRIRP